MEVRRDGGDDGAGVAGRSGRSGPPSFGRYSRRASVAVLVGDGLDAAAPGYRDVAVLETQIETHY